MFRGTHPAQSGLATTMAAAVLLGIAQSASAVEIADGDAAANLGVEFEAGFMDSFTKRMGRGIRKAARDAREALDSRRRRFDLDNQS